MSKNFAKNIKIKTKWLIINNIKKHPLKQNERNQRADINKRITQAINSLNKKKGIMGLVDKNSTKEEIEKTEEKSIT